MEGKKFLTLSLLLYILLLKVQASPATLRGGLLYADSVSPRAIYINQHRFTVTRKADTAFIQKGTQLNRDLTNLYGKFVTELRLR